MADQKNQERCQEVDDYIAGFEAPVRERLEAVRSLVLETAAGCSEKLAWGAPTYYLNGYLLQFAAYKKHLGFYTTPATLEHWKEALSGYKTNEKTTVQFPHNPELPLDLMTEMILFRIRVKETESQDTNK